MCVFFSFGLTWFRCIWFAKQLSQLTGFFSSSKEKLLPKNWVYFLIDEKNSIFPFSSPFFRSSIFRIKVCVCVFTCVYLHLKQDFYHGLPLNIENDGSLLQSNYKYILDSVTTCTHLPFSQHTCWFLSFIVVVAVAAAVVVIFLLLLFLPPLHLVRIKTMRRSRAREFI